MPSSVITAFHYHTDQEQLDIRFVSGWLYSYFDVPRQLYEAMKASPSKGEFFNRHIRDHFRFSRKGRE